MGGGDDARVIVTVDVLAGLDRIRRAAGAPGRVVREVSAEGAECRIVFVDCSPGELGEVIGAEVRRADAAGYVLEWKTYEHDPLPGIADRLVAAGFEPEAVECVLVAEVGAVGFGSPVVDIRQVRDAAGLADVAAIGREMGRSNVKDEVRSLGAVLRDTPERMSVHVAYVDGVPVACGRVYFPPGGPFAELAGGRTRTTHRNRGLFTALVAARLREARARGRTHVFVDALPTSEPILRKRGFEFVTRTQPFVYAPAGATGAVGAS